MRDSAYMKTYSDVYKCLSDRTRLRIVRLLAQAGFELCVCELVDSLEESQYNVSRHLKVLKRSGLVGERKVGRWVYYGLRKKNDGFIDLILKSVQAISEPSVKKDTKELKRRLSLRTKGKCLLGIQKKRLAPVIGDRSARWTA